MGRAGKTKGKDKVPVSAPGKAVAKGHGNTGGSAEGGMRGRNRGGQPVRNMSSSVAVDRNKTRGAASQKLVDTDMTSGSNRPVSSDELLLGASEPRPQRFATGAIRNGAVDEIMEERIEAPIATMNVTGGPVTDTSGSSVGGGMGSGSGISETANARIGMKDTVEGDGVSELTGATILSSDVVVKTSFLNVVMLTKCAADTLEAVLSPDCNHHFLNPLMLDNPGKSGVTLLEMFHSEGKSNVDSITAGKVLNDVCVACFEMVMSGGDPIYNIGSGKLVLPRGTLCCCN
jgi:hypothetical protein